jgi:hypothetical protein
VSIEVPPAPNRMGGIPVYATLGDAWRLMVRYPRAVLMPMVLIEVPLAILTAAASAILYLGVFSNETYPPGGLLGVDEAGSPAFAAALVAGINALFVLVGQAATIVAVADASRGKPRPVAQSLDPAFTRMGALFGFAFLLVAIIGGLAVTVIGLFVLPYIALRIGLTLQVLILEGQSPFRAMRGSWSALRGHLLRFLALISLTFVTLLPVLAFRAVHFAFDGAGRDTRIAADSVFAVVESLLILPVAVFATAATTLFYLQIKARNDARPAS